LYRRGFTRLAGQAQFIPRAGLLTKLFSASSSPEFSSAGSADGSRLKLAWLWFLIEAVLLPPATAFWSMTEPMFAGV